MKNLKDTFFLAAQDVWTGCKRKPTAGCLGATAVAVFTSLAAVGLADGNFVGALMALIIPAIVVKSTHDLGRTTRLKNNPPGPGANGPQ